MAATHQQRAKLSTTLAETMGDEAADTLMAELPPGGWEQMATKDDLAGVETRLTATMTAGFAELSVKLAEGLAHAATERAAIVKDQAEMLKGQARQLYVIVTTIVAATVSIWIALFSALGS